MSELAWTVAVIAVPFLWTQYRRIQNNRAHRALVAQIERQQRQDSQPPPSILTAATLNHSAAPVVGPAGPASSAKQRLTPTLQFILVCLIIHEGWIIWEIVYDQPINIFVAMDVPVTTLVSKLKKLLLEFSGERLAVLSPKADTYTERGLAQTHRHFRLTSTSSSSAFSPSIQEHTMCGTDTTSSSPVLGVRVRWTICCITSHTSPSSTSVPRGLWLS